MKCSIAAGILAISFTNVGAHQAAKPAAPVKAVGSIDLKDPAGDMGPITTSGTDQPPLDIVGLSIKSDGKALSFSITLAAPPGRWATNALSVYVDTDNKPATGIKSTAFLPGGFEYKADIDVCMKYSNGMEACIGGTTDAKATVAKRYAAIDLKHFKGDSEHGNDETILDAMGIGGKASAQVPVTGAVIQASIDYADLKLKPGQTIRLLCRETGGAPKDRGFFPEIALTVK